MLRRRAGRSESASASPSRPAAAPSTHPDGAVYVPDPKEGADFSWWPSYGPEGYLGQLADDFQADLAKSRAFLQPEHCRFYHSIDLPDGTAISGAWDLRGRERAYLGDVDLRGKRVLELGPSSGYLTFWMEKQGADVVSFDAGWDASIDLLPAPGFETRKLRRDHAKVVSDFSNSWWYLHRRLGSRAKVVYGDIYDLPGDLGTFDVATFGCICLHLRDPIQAIEEAARRGRPQTIIVTDCWRDPDTMMDNIMRPFPAGEGSRWVVWWQISAGAIVEVLKIMGYADVTVTTHTQLHLHGHDPANPWVEEPMFTVVAHRT
jgi:SAM-dependent methyltransferase